MPIVNGKYVNPGWVNGTTPDIDAEEMNAISNTLARVPIENGGTGAVTEKGARYNLGFTFEDYLPVSLGGTGAKNAADARENLGFDRSNGTLPINLGGTGADNPIEALENLLANNSIPLENGGTGATSRQDAIKNLFGTDKPFVPIDGGGTGVSAIESYSVGNADILAWGPVVMLTYKSQSTGTEFVETIPSKYRPFETIYGTGAVFASSETGGASFSEGYAQAVLSNATGKLTVKAFTPSGVSRVVRVMLCYLRPFS